MASVLRTPQAKADLIELWLYIATDSATAADRLLATIDEKCRLLARFPEMGQSCDELAPLLRCFSVGNYVIFYRPAESGVEIIRVVSGARDIESLFKAED